MALKTYEERMETLEVLFKTAPPDVCLRIIELAAALDKDNFYRCSLAASATVGHIRQVSA